MKKIIHNKVYDTDTARELGQDSYSNSRDFHYWHEVLYQKRTGEFFLYGEGGPMSRYARSIDQNSWSGGQKIMPLSAANARQWAEEHLDADDYEAIFGLPDEDAEKVTLSVQLPADLSAQIRQNAADNGMSLTAYVEALLRKALGVD